MNKHKLTLLGGPSGELRVSALVLQEALGALVEGARHATRFAVEGESNRKGPRPAWLDAACAIDVTALSAGSASLALEAPSLRDADATRFGDAGQPFLFDDHAPPLQDQTSVDLFGSVLASLIEGQGDDIAADRALLQSCVRFARVASAPFEGLQLEGLRGRKTPLVIRSEHVARIERLRDETPPPQAVRVSGVLDTISASRSDVLLTLGDGTKVPARLEEHDASILRGLFGKEVVISGIAHFRPSGKLLLVEVESLGPANSMDRLFAASPIARNRAAVFTAASQNETSGVSAFFATWPGDETEEELLDALRAIE